MLGWINMTDLTPISTLCWLLQLMNTVHVHIWELLAHMQTQYYLHFSNAISTRIDNKTLYVAGNWFMVTDHTGNVKNIWKTCKWQWLSVFLEWFKIRTILKYFWKDKKTDNNKLYWTALIDDIGERRNREVSCMLRVRVMVVHEERALIVSLETGRNCQRVQALTSTLFSLSEYLTF